MNAWISRHRLFWASVPAALAGLLFGLDTGVIAGALRFIKASFHPGTRGLEGIVSVILLGAAVGAALGGLGGRRLGRVRLLRLAGGLFVLGALACAGAPGVPLLVAGRFVLGLAVGFAAFTAPLYLAEIAPPSRRGLLVSAYQLLVTVGILLAYLSDTALSGSGDWRAMFGVLAVPGAIFLVGCLFIPESPRWLLTRGEEGRARDVLRGLGRSPEVAEREVREIAARLETPQHGWELWRHDPNVRRSVALGVLLQVMQQLTGINVVMYYAPRIFRALGYAPALQMDFTILVGLVNVLATVAALFLVDRWGRKPILYAGFAAMAVSMASVALVLGSGGGPLADHVAVVMLLVFIVGFAMSAGPIVWTLCAEIQPLQARDFGIGVSTVANWVANMIVAATFLSLLDVLGRAETFWLYAGFNAAFILLTLLWVPETRGVSLEKLEGRLLKGVPLRALGTPDTPPG